MNDTFLSSLQGKDNKEQQVASREEFDYDLYRNSLLLFILTLLLFITTF